MKYENEMTETDRADLERAAAMVKDGKALRQRVLTRVRSRVWRAKQSEGKE